MFQSSYNTLIQKNKILQSNGKNIPSRSWCSLNVKEGYMIHFMVIGFTFFFSFLSTVVMFKIHRRQRPHLPRGHAEKCLRYPPSKETAV